VVRTALSWSPDGYEAQSSGQDLIESGRMRQPPDGGESHCPDAPDLSACSQCSVRPDDVNASSGRGPHSVYKYPCSSDSLHTPQNLNFWLLASYLSLSSLPFCIFLSYLRYFSSLFLFSFFFKKLLECYFFWKYEMHINCDITLYLFFTQVLFTAVILTNFCYPNKNIFRIFFGQNSCWIFCRIMSAGSPPRRVRQRLVEDRAAIQSKIMDRTVIAERNILRAYIMVPPLDNILAIIQTYNWGYLHSCACVVYTRLVKLFYANMEVV